MNRHTAVWFAIAVIVLVVLLKITFFSLDPTIGDPGMPTPVSPLVPASVMIN